MPTTYTHDLFGKQVYRKLPPEVKRLIRENGNLYRIGLHGPDILFYFMVSKNPVTQYGIRMHEERARGFFQENMAKVRKNRKENRALLAYLLGFGCHYLLDSYCHPYVEEVARAGVVSHTLLEKEFDRYLMLKTGKNPLVYRPSDAIAATRANAEIIHQTIPDIRTGNILISLKMMKFLTNRMVCNDGGRKRRVVSRVTAAGGKKRSDSLTEFFMTEKPVEAAIPYVKELNRYYEEEVLAAPEELLELYSLAGENRPLSARWNRTYNG